MTDKSALSPIIQPQYCGSHAASEYDPARAEASLAEAENLFEEPAAEPAYVDRTVELEIEPDDDALSDADRAPPAILFDGLLPAGVTLIKGGGSTYPGLLLLQAAMALAYNRELFPR